MYIVAHRSGVERIVRKLLTRRALATLCATPLLVAIDFGGAPSLVPRSLPPNRRKLPNSRTPRNKRRRNPPYDVLGRVMRAGVRVQF
jgi:hypothetical protein